MSNNNKNNNNDNKNNNNLVSIGLSFYNDKVGLQRCLESLELDNPKNNVIDKVIAVDGRYYGFKSKSLLSTDGSRELVEKQWIDRYPDKIELYDVINKPEYLKRQAYVDIAGTKHHSKFLLIIDADEWLYPKPNWVKLYQRLMDIIESTESNSDKNIYWVKCVDVLTTGRKKNIISYHPYQRRRLWFRPELLYYAGNHNTFKRRDRVIINKIDDVNTRISEDIIQIYHNPIDCRSDNRRQKQLNYESILNELES